MTAPALVVLAAGMGSRYGGLKQIDPVGPHGELVIDYSIYDALRAGFGRVVFVIRRDLQDTFHEAIGRRIGMHAPVDYAFQELTALPPGQVLPPGRVKPWGTAHAILSAASAVQEPFAAINADDFYGATSFQLQAAALQETSVDSTDYSMVAFVLRHTLSKFGSVARGLCRTDEQGFLQQVREHTRIEPDGENARWTSADGQSHPLSGDELVSMNLLGFSPAIFRQLEERFAQFLATAGNDLKAEFFIPSVLDDLIRTHEARVKVLRTPDHWFGVTYKEDKERVVQEIRALVARGLYPEKLWG